MLAGDSPVHCGAAGADVAVTIDGAEKRAFRFARARTMAVGVAGNWKNIPAKILRTSMSTA